MTLYQITKEIQALEKVIATEQSFINKSGSFYDANSTPEWEQYKTQAKANLNTWDALKTKRDQQAI